MSGFIPADDRQASLHAYRMVGEHLALFRQALRDNGIDGPVVDALTERFYAQIMANEQQSTLLQALRKLTEGGEGDG